MGRVKDLLYDGPDGFNELKFGKDSIPDHRWFMNPDLRFDTEYEEWLNSEGYVAFVNDEMDLAKPIYGKGDLVDALQYASKSIIIEPEEVGKEIYNRLFSEKVVEYLNNLNE